MRWQNLLIKVNEFVFLLRAAGVNVRSEEVVDFLRALEYGGWDEDFFFTALSATLAKSSYERRLCHHLWQEVFLRYLRNRREENGVGGNGGSGEVAGKGIKQGPKLPPGEFQRHLERLKSELAGDLLALRSSSGAYVGPMSRAGITTKVGRPEDERVRVGCTVTDGNQNLAGDNPAAKGSATPKRDQVGKELPVELTQLVEGVRRRYNFWFTDFADLAEPQRQQLRSYVQLLGRKLAVKKGFRCEPASSGWVDLRRTVEKAALTGGVPLHLNYQQRRLQRPHLLLLCDLSGSVRPYLEFLLYLVQSIQERFRSVRTLGFVDRVRDITEFLAQGEPATVLQLLAMRTDLWRGGFSDYGAVWEDLRQNWRHLLERDRILLIFGDARNNYKPDRQDDLHTITKMVKKTLWFNPLPAPAWEKDDCIFSVYRPYCTAAFECRNLSQLWQAVRQII